MIVILQLIECSCKQLFTLITRVKLTNSSLCLYSKGVVFCRAFASVQTKGKAKARGVIASDEVVRISLKTTRLMKRNISLVLI